MDLERAEATDYSKVDPAFSYFGSKNRLAYSLCESLPPHNAWIELFCGSAALTLAKPPAPLEVINDLDGDVINLFEQLRNNHVELCRQIALTPYSREELNICRTPNPDASSLERARRFMVCSMMAINGVFGINKGGFSCSQSYSRGGKEARVNRWYNLPERIAEVAERLRGVRIENKDAISLFESFSDKPASLIYLDPPYLGDRQNGYNIDNKDEVFHANLLKLANRARCMVFISGYDNPLYHSLLTPKKGWEYRSIQASTKDSTGKSFKRTELLWTNQHFNKASRTGRISIRFSKRELKINKINPSR